MLYVIRHGERLDEVDEDGWRQTCSMDKSRNIRDAIEDTPLSERGFTMADTAAETMSNILSGSGKAPLQALYCSRLTRAIQTAYPLAKRLGVPLRVSSCISRSALAVRKSVKAGKAYEFLPLAVMAKECKGVALEDVDDPLHPLHVPFLDWKQACAIIALRGGTNIIVAHRETVRGLANNKDLRTPHCCIASFSCTSQEDAPTLSLPSTSSATSSASAGSVSGGGDEIVHVYRVEDLERPVTPIKVGKGEDEQGLPLALVSNVTLDGTPITALQPKPKPKPVGAGTGVGGPKKKEGAGGYFPPSLVKRI